MLARANEIKAKHNKTNVSFVDAPITDMSAIPSGTADCIISNCVINLVPEADKPLVFREMHRLLKPGGRVAVSDILAKKPLPERLRANMALYVGCVSGASLVGQYERYLAEAGFETGSVVIRDDGADLNVYLETNPDGTRTAGGTGGNLCCNPSIPSAAPATSSAPAASSCCSSKPAVDQSSTTVSSSCDAGEKKSAPVVAPASSGFSGGKSKTDAVMESAAAAAAASSSSSCCGGGSKPDQSYAFDEKDLADLEGENLNDWAGKSIPILLLCILGRGLCCTNLFSRIVQDLCRQVLTVWRGFLASWRVQGSRCWWRSGLRVGDDGWSDATVTRPFGSCFIMIFCPAGLLVSRMFVVVSQNLCLVDAFLARWEFYSCGRDLPRQPCLGIAWQP